MLLPSVAAVAVVRRAGEPLVSALALHLKPNAVVARGARRAGPRDSRRDVRRPAAARGHVVALGDALVERIAQARPLLVGGGSDLTIGVTGAAGLVALALLNAALVLVRRRTPVTPAR